MIKTVVRWRFNRKFRIQRTFKSKAEAKRYAFNIDKLWGIKAKMATK